MPNAQETSEARTLEAQDLQHLFDVLKKEGYRIVGPTVRDGAIIYDDLQKRTDLPVGWTDEQDGATYRLKKRNDKALFGYVVGPHSWKKYLFPPEQRLFKARRVNGNIEFETQTPQTEKLAFLGVRSCELKAMGIQDKVFTKGTYTDPGYKARRENALVIAVDCGQAGGTCFCVSMKSGPRVESDFDLALTELIDDKRHSFLIRAGSSEGARILKQLPAHPAPESDHEAARQVTNRAAGQMGRTLDTNGIKQLLYDNYEHSQWDDVASRCLACANCTLVCPTCFCATIEDVTDLTGDHAERWRKWDSCFTLDFSYIAGGSVRTSTKSRYRQWMTHKLATWIDQFGTSGCVGCGRCITWCPVAIDITEETRAIRESTEPQPAGATPFRTG